MTKKLVVKRKKVPVAKAKKVAGKAKFILLPDQGSPLVYIDFALKFGSLSDPSGKEGLASIMLSMMLRGTQKKSSQEFHQALDNIGAEIHLGKFKESVRIYGVVLVENLNPFMELLKEMITAPRFSEEEFAKIKEQFRSALLDELSSDDDIAERRFQEYLLWGHPYGRSSSGTLKSIAALELNDIKEFYRKIFCSSAAIFSATGAFQKDKLKKKMEEILSLLPAGNFSREEIADPVVPTGRNLIILDKPDRTQSQVYIGSKGIGFTDPLYLSMVIANHVFGGGSFSARLMKEVREKRGWSYGAYAWFRSGRKPLYFGMQTVPSNKDTAPAVQLMLQLFEDYSKRGISKEEFAFAKKSLVNQSAFMQDTLRKRLDNKITEEILGLPKGFYDTYVQRLRRITHAQVQKAIRKTMDSKNMFLLVLCTASELKKDLEKLPGLKSVYVKKFDEEPSVSVY